jgi:hypothetical protein
MRARAATKPAASDALGKRGAESPKRAARGHPKGGRPKKRKRG